MFIFDILLDSKAAISLSVACFQLGCKKYIQDRLGHINRRQRRDKCVVGRRLTTNNYEGYKLDGDREWERLQ